MNSKQVFDILGYFRVTLVNKKYCYYNVFSCEELDTFTERSPFLIIVNTSPKPYDGHWVAFLMLKKNGPVEYFDAFNMPPKFYNENFPKFIERLNVKLRMMPRAIQCYDSNACGPHALRYIYYRLKGISINHIYSKLFIDGCRKNDQESKLFVKRIVKKFPSWYKQHLLY